MTPQLRFRLAPPAAQAAEALASLVGVAKVGVAASPVAVGRVALALAQAVVKAGVSAGRVAVFQRLLCPSSKVSGLDSRPNQPLACLPLTTVLRRTECDESTSTPGGQQVSSSDLAAYKLVSRSTLCQGSAELRFDPRF
jgi:hypothetical protein